MNPTLAGLLQSCMHASDFDSLPWLILADWLEDHHDPRGAIVRLHHRAAVTGFHDRARLTALGVTNDDLNARGWHYHRNWMRNPNRIADVDWPMRMILDKLPDEQSRSFSECVEAISQSPWIRMEIRRGLQAGADAFARVVRYADAIDGVRWSFSNLAQGRLSQLQSLPKLRNLTLYPTDQLTTDDVIDLSQLTTLRRLEIKGILSRTDAKWEQLAHLRNLESLRMTQSCHSAIPRHVYEILMGAMPLRELVLDRFFDPMNLAQFGGWRQLQVLQLRRLCDWDLGSSRLLEGFPDLARLSLQRAQFGLELIAMEQIAALVRLHILDISAVPDLSDDHVQLLISSKSIEEIDLSANPHLTQQSLHTLTAIPSLRWLDVRYNRNLSAEACQRFREARPDITLLADHL